MSDPPTPDQLGWLTLLGLGLLAAITKFAKDKPNLFKPVAWLTSTGLKAWLDKEVFSPMRETQTQQAEKITRQSEQIKLLEAENLRLIGLIDGVSLRVIDHEDRLRTVESLNTEWIVSLRHIQHELERDNAADLLVSQTLVDISETLARLTAQHEAAQLKDSMLTEDLRELRQFVLRHRGE
jgi:hypothetical protein